MAELTAGDLKITNGKIQVANGIEKYGAGDIDINDNINLTLGMGILLENPSDTATASIKRTATALEIDPAGTLLKVIDSEENPLTIESNDGTKSLKISKTTSEATLLNEYDDIVIDGETGVILKLNGTALFIADSNGNTFTDDVIVESAHLLTLKNGDNTEQSDIYRDDTALNIDAGTGGIVDIKIAGASELKIDATKTYPSTTLGQDLGGTSNIFGNTYSEDLHQYDTRWLNPPLDGEIETTSNSWTTLVSKAVTTNEAWMIKAYVIGYDTNGSVAAWEIVGTFKNAGGVVTQVGTTTSLVAHEDAPSTTDIKFNVSGTSVQLQVQGTTYHMRWNVNFDITRVPVGT